MHVELSWSPVDRHALMALRAGKYSLRERRRRDEELFVHFVLDRFHCLMLEKEKKEKNNTCA